MQVLVEGGYVDVEHPRRSRFLELLAFENGPMYKVFTPAEREIIMDWMESLRPEPRAKEQKLDRGDTSGEPAGSNGASDRRTRTPERGWLTTGSTAAGPDGRGVPHPPWTCSISPGALLQALSHERLGRSRRSK